MHLSMNMRLVTTLLLLALSSFLAACCCSQQERSGALPLQSSSSHSFQTSNKTAVIIHGLNTKPDVMHDIADVFIKNRYTVLNITLPGHGNSQEVSEPANAWATTALDGVRRGRMLADTSELVLVGYSLGGALAVLASQHPSAPKIDKMVLIAPALRIRIPLFLLRLGNLPLLDEIPIPSIAPQHIRRWCSIPLEWYAAIPKVLDQIDGYLESETFRSIPTTVVLNPRDEVISMSKTLDWLKLHSLNNTWVVKTNNSAPSSSSFENFEHNLVERSALGKQGWSELEDVLIH
jgi:esterase/lipase